MRRLRTYVHNKARGFTLIETLVAVLLLSTALAGPLTIASKGLTSSLIAKDQVGAFFLAQDAVEYIRFKRDSNKLCLEAGSSAGTCSGVSSWLTGLSACASADGTAICRIDSIQDTVDACSGACPTLKYNAANKFYTYATGANIAETAERYVRSIRITTPVGSNTDEASLTVTVEWRGPSGVTHSVVVRETIFDW